MFTPEVDEGPPPEREPISLSAERAVIDLRDDDASVAAKLVTVMRLRDPSLADHAQRTAEIATAIAAELGLAVDELDRIYLAAQLHDIGKLGVAESILWKPAGLTTREWREMRTHPEEGHRLVADVTHRDVAAAVLYHHERMDGDGYPFGIDGRSLPVTVKIIQVADAFDAMTSIRPYQAALPSDIAVSEIARCAGSQFDPDVAGALERVFARRDDRFEGRIVAQPSGTPEMPADPFGLITLSDRPT